MTLTDLLHPAQKTDADDRSLALAARHDHAAFEQLYRRYVNRVYRYCYARTGSPHDAEDLTAQTFVAALEGIGRFRHRGSFAAWLFAIAWRKCNDYHRRQYRQQHVPLAAAAGLDDPETPDLEQHATEQRLLDCVRLAVSKLSPDRRDALRLRFWGGLTTAEIATVMGRRQGAVKMLVSRAIADLRERCLNGD